ncbi:MAG: hypothetical protein QW374_01420 [Candidatus Bathyarchaeia archaeon]|nr:hypothetical protein [Candidatus Bathyarchaeota archaeon]
MDRYDAKSYLVTTRNVKKGLRTRSRIIELLRIGISDANTISEAIGRSYSATLKQLRKMERDGIVVRVSRRPSTWRITGKGQQELAP